MSLEVWTAGIRCSGGELVPAEHFDTVEKRMVIPVDDIDFRGLSSMTRNTTEKSFVLPVNYDTFFRSRLVIITGAGRSGTTITGKLLGSMRPVYYLFEPAVLRLALQVRSLGKVDVYSQLPAILFEDYFLPQIQGRNLNSRLSDDSGAHNYFCSLAVNEHSCDITRRQDALAHLQAENPWFAFKVPGMQCALSAFQEVFTNPLLIHVMRNGNDVVASTVKRGWFNDTYMREQVVDWVRGRRAENVNVPWYLDETSAVSFQEGNIWTRAACVWRVLTEKGLEFKGQSDDQMAEIRYEELVEKPRRCVDRLSRKMGTEPTVITEQHVRDIERHICPAYDSIVDRIEQPERNRFVTLMNKLGYEL